MKLLILTSGLLFLVKAQLELEPSQHLIHLDRNNLDQRLLDTSKPWVIMVCREFSEECLKSWPVWERIGREYGDQFHIAELGGLLNTEATLRLSAGASPTFFFSQDGFHFLDYYWPREFEDLVAFITGGYKRWPEKRYRTLQAASSWIFFRQSGVKILQAMESEVDSFTKKYGIPQIPLTVKIGILVAILIVISSFLVFQFYLCLYEPVGEEFSFRRELELKPKFD